VLNQNLLHASVDTKCTKSCDDQTTPVPARTVNILTCVKQTHPMPGRKQNACQHVLSKSSHASEDTKSISKCIDQPPPTPASTQNISELLLNKLIQCAQGHKMHLNMCRLNPSNVTEDKHPITAMIHNVS
jgi:hypothetical protein